MRFYFSLLFAMLLFVNILPQEDEIKGKKAINFKLEDIEGNIFELKKEIGKGPILLTFWATWCKPCAEEMTQFNKIYNEFESKGFKLVGISIDNEKSVSRVLPYVKSRGYKFPVLLDTNSEVGRKYYAQAVPYSVLIDKEGKIVYSHMGYMPGDEIKVKKLIQDLLK